jgi:hypothetical protein
MLSQSPKELLRRFFASRTWRQLLKPMLILTVVVTAGLTVGVNYVVPQLESQITGSGDLRVSRSGEGELKYSYKKGSEPKGYSEELSADSARLITLNWDSRNPASVGKGEDDLGPAVPSGDRKAIVAAAASFLGRWETFSSGQSPASYQRSFASFADPASLSALTERKDSLENNEIGIRGLAGSVSYPQGLNPAKNADIVRYSDNNALLNAIGSVKLTGPSLVFKGRELRRAYGIVMRRLDGRWVVVRCAAQTLGDTVD